MPMDAFSQVALPPGARATTIVRAADGTLYVGIDNVRVAKSASSGASWTACGSVQGHDVNVLVLDPSGVLYFSGDDGAFASHDGCATWQALDSPGGPSFALAGPNLLVGAWGGVWESSGGAWSQLSTPMDGHIIQDLAVDTNGTRIFIASDNGVATSSDSGTTWTLVNSGLGGVDAQYVALDPVRPLHLFAQASNELYLSTDGAASWTAATLAGWTAAIDPASPDFVLQSTWNGLVESSDGGASFGGNDERSPKMALSAVMGMVFGPSSQLFAATNRGVFTAPDHNLAWTEIDTGLDAWTVNQMTAADNGTLYLTTPSGVLVSSDAGATWTDQTQGMQWDSFTTGSVQLPGSPDTLLFAGSDGILQTVDGGGSFTTIYSTGIADNYHASTVHIVNGEIVAATWGGIVTSDASRTVFTHHDVAGQTRYVYDVVAIDTAAMQLLAITETGLFFTSDGGATFVAADAGLDASVFRVAILPDGTLLAGTDQGIFRASAPTGPWNPSGLGPATINDLLVAQGHVVAATSLGVFASTDGAAWTFIPGLEGMNPSALAVDTAGRLLVGTTGYGLYITPLP